MKSIIVKKEDGYFITSEDIPTFLKTCCFQDEYEANLAQALWFQYSKDKLVYADYNEFRWIMKATFRLLGRTSIWAE